MADQVSGSIETLANRIYVIRRHKVMLDSDLANLYGVSTKRLNQQVRRNRKRFPEDFVFQLTAAEEAALRSQIATSKTGRGGRRNTSMAFTEHGAIMAAAILNSSRAVQMSIFVVRAFVQLRESISLHRAIAAKLTELERKVSGQGADIAKIFAVLRKLTTQPESKRRGIGFTADLGGKAVDERTLRAPGWDEMPPVGRER
jgi:hypothetical protein